MAFLSQQFSRLRFKIIGGLLVVLCHKHDYRSFLYTKGFFEARIQEFENRFYQIGQGFSIMMIDLDHFKKVNDTYGHPVDDKVLRQIAELIRQSMRHGDIPCRYGGERVCHNAS